MPARVPQKTKVKYFRLRDRGYGRVEAARACGINRKTGYVWEMTLAGQGGRDYRNPSIADRDLAADVEAAAGEADSDLARACLADFELFRRTVLGHVSAPWHVDAANRVVALLGTPDREYAVFNAPPGSGKTTLFAEDLVLWLIARNRRVRILIGSSTQNLAEKYVNRVRRHLDRKTPAKAKIDDLTAGRAVDATHTMAQLFGRFRTDNDVWTREKFVVAQVGDDTITDKEETCVAYGRDTGQLGGRYDVVLWDDLVTKQVLRSADGMKALREDWDDEFETRLEPGGLLLLQGQRLRADDLYRYCADKETAADDGDLPQKMYAHIVYRAHYDELCTGRHPHDAPAYNPASPVLGGCLLDPRRQSWKDLAGVRRNARKFRVLYQQEDVDPENQIVRDIHIYGGTEHGETYPGCVDRDRGLWAVPPGLAGPLVVTGTVDPSGERSWGVEVWAHHPASEQAFLVALRRASMKASDLLDWNHATQQWTGLMEDWQVQSIAAGLPIKVWIIEKNAAQRYLLQYEHVLRWQRHHGVRIIGHETGRNKADPEKGIEACASKFHYGQVRLPWLGDSRIESLKLIEEIVAWPEFPTSDLVMAWWFHEYNLPRLKPRPPVRLVRDDVPAWVRRIA